MAQKPKETPEIVQAIKIHKEHAANLSTFQVDAFQIEDGVVMRAHKGWEIFIDYEAKAFVVRKTGTKTKAKDAPKGDFSEFFTEDEYIGFCYCPPKASGTCKFTFEQVGNTQLMKCEGNCECTRFFIYEPPTSPPEILHPDMGWQQFPDWWE